MAAAAFLQMIFLHRRNGIALDSFPASWYHMRMKYSFPAAGDFVMRTMCIALTLVASAFLLSPVRAADDEVLSIIDQAVIQYNEGDLSGAASNLDYASQLIRQKKSEAMKELLPEPLPGWEAEPASAQAMGTAVFGGGVNVSRSYKRQPSAITIDIVSDSPVLQSLIMMLSNPMIAGASGGKLEMIANQKAIVQFDQTSGNGEVNIVADNRFMVTVKGQKVKREDLIAYARSIDYKLLSEQ
jgi:hypothetical protein